MRIHNEQVEIRIQNLLQAISRDSLSLQDWKCLHIALSEHVDEEIVPLGFAEWMEPVQEQYKHLDCDVYLCADGDIFIIGKNLNHDLLYKIGKAICETLRMNGEKHSYYYDMHEDGKTVLALLKSKINQKLVDLSELLKSPHENANGAEELKDFKLLFEDAKQRRRTRNPLHIMLVEDDQLTRQLVAKSLKQDFAIITACDTEEAVTNYLLYAPDIVFLDINLPDGDGFSVLEQIMALDDDAYVIMFSGNSYLDNVTHALSHGAHGFIAKPFKKDQIQHYINEFLSTHKNKH